MTSLEELLARMPPTHFVLDENDQPVPCRNLIEWAMWMFARDAHVFDHEVVAGVRVSTVYMGQDYLYDFHGDGRPRLWETMVLGGPLDLEQERYASLADARSGHARWVARVLAANTGILDLGVELGVELS